jgi:hypothetical protein
MEKIVILYAQIHLIIALSKRFVNTVKTEEKRIKGSGGMLIRLRVVGRQGIEFAGQFKSVTGVYRTDQRGSDFAYACQRCNYF